MAELLSSHTTLRLGGPAGDYVEATTEAELIEAIRSADDAGIPVLLLGGGSNLVVSDEGFAGRVVKIATRGIVVDDAGCDVDDLAVCGGLVITVAAGENWDDLVAMAVQRNWTGIEALSGIPGLVGASPIQNVGAYGQEVADTLWSVRTWDRVDQTQRTFAFADCGFGYRTSRFKEERFDDAGSRYVVLEVSFQLKMGTMSAPLRYGELARTLGVDGEGSDGRALITDVREAVLKLRAGKGMVLDETDHDTWSAGSFFTNPLLSAEQAAGLPDDAPRWPQPDGTVKTSAAWLIEHAGFTKGHGLDQRGGRVSLSTKHTLALTNRGAGTTDDLLTLAREVRDGVEREYAVELVNEPVFVGLQL